MNLAAVAVRLFPVLSFSESRLSAFLDKRPPLVDMLVPQVVVPVSCHDLLGSVCILGILGSGICLGRPLGLGFKPSIPRVLY